MVGPETIDLSGATYQGPGAQKAARDTAGLTGENLSNVQKGINIQTDTATAPFAGPKAQAELANAQLKTLLDMSQNARDELKTL